MKSRLRSVILIGLTVLGAAAAWLFVTRSTVPPRAEMMIETSAGMPRPADARTAADQVLLALKARNGAMLAELIDSDGVRLSPNAFVNVADDQVLSPDEVRVLWTTTTRRIWGHSEGSGNVIHLTSASYFSRYVLDHDYSDAKVGVNADTDRGTSSNNASKVYPGATRVEYFWQGNEPLNWSILRLVLLPVDGSWRLVGIIHDEWTP